MVGGFHEVLLRNIQDLLSDGKTPYERAMLENHPIPAMDISRLHLFGKKVLPGKFFGYVLYAVRIWKGDTLVAELEELEEMDASQRHARRLKAKEVLTPMKGDNFIFPVEDRTVKVSGGDQRLRPSASIWDRPERGEEQEVLRRESDGLSCPNPLQDGSTLDDAEAENDFWSIYRRVHLSSSRGSQSQTQHAKRRIISYSTEAHRRYQNNTHVTGRIV